MRFIQFKNTHERNNRKHRGISSTLEDNIPNKYSTNITKIENFLYYYIYNDKKIVKFISTIYGYKLVEKKSREWKRDLKTGRKESSTITKKIPHAILTYNENMNGVDRLNQSIKTFNMSRKSRKWNHKLSIYIFSVILHNSYILWGNEENKRKTRKNFLSIVCKNLLDFNPQKFFKEFAQLHAKRKIW
jgi:hypothetical protein